MIDDRLMNAHEVAELLQVDVEWVRRHTRAGNVPCITLGRYRRYRRSDIVAWIDERSSGGDRRRLRVA